MYIFSIIKPSPFGMKVENFTVAYIHKKGQLLKIVQKRHLWFLSTKPGFNDLPGPQQLQFETAFPRHLFPRNSKLGKWVKRNDSGYSLKLSLSLSLTISVSFYLVFSLSLSLLRPLYSTHISVYWRHNNQ